MDGGVPSITWEQVEIDQLSTVEQAIFLLAFSSPATKTDQSSKLSPRSLLPTDSSPPD